MPGASAGSLPRDNLVETAREAFVRREEVDLDVLCRETRGAGAGRPVRTAQAGSAISMLRRCESGGGLPRGRPRRPTRGRLRGIPDLAGARAGDDRGHEHRARNVQGSCRPCGRGRRRRPVRRRRRSPAVAASAPRGIVGSHCDRADRGRGAGGQSPSDRRSGRPHRPRRRRSLGGIRPPRRRVGARRDPVGGHHRGRGCGRRSCETPCIRPADLRALLSRGR